MKIIVIIITFSFFIKAQTDTFIIHVALSKYDTIAYKRIVNFDKNKKLYDVRDYYENGQVQMQASYSAIDKNIKEYYQCNYHSNTKEGLYREWYENGQIEYLGNFKDGLRDGLCKGWYKNGQLELEEHWLNGQLNGNVKYWNEQGNLQYNLEFKDGLNQNPKNVFYHYINYLPPNYNLDSTKKWPLIIYLHGGAERGTDTIALYTAGPFDQIYRGRKFPFIIISPQCPKNIRWSTDNWFENLYNEITSKYRVDTNKIYLTGNSLGGAGTWYIAEKYHDKFAAIAPISGFTSHIEYIYDNVDKLIDMPIWAFHGKIDMVVPFEETERIVRLLKWKNKELRFTIKKDFGHGIDWLVYPKQELYDWFLKYDKRFKQIK